MRSRQHAQRMHALQSRALVGGAALIDYRGCGLIGGRGVRTNYPWIRHWFICILYMAAILIGGLALST